MPARIDLPHDELVTLYVEQRKSLLQTGLALGVSVECVQTNLRRYGIQTRGLSESHLGQSNSPATQFKPGQRPHNERDLPIAELVRLYTVERWSSVRIGAHFGVDHKPILARLHLAGVTIDRAASKRGRPASLETRRKLSTMRSGKPQPQLQTPAARAKSAAGVKAAHRDRVFGWQAIARENRRRGGTVEELFFERLLRRRGITGFVREHVVHTKAWGKARYLLDFAWPNERLGVEIDGSSHRRRRENDQRKDERVSSQGWRLLRITTERLRREPHAVVDEIARLLN